MNWNYYPLKKVAPSATPKLTLNNDKPIWHLNLDQIESHTGNIINKKVARVSTAGNSTYFFDTSNVLYSKLRPYLNKVVCPDEQGIATTELVPLCPNPKLLDRKFLTYFLRSSSFVNFASNAVSGAKMPRLIMAKFWGYEIPIPPLTEQRRIVEILDQASLVRLLRAEADKKAQQILSAIFIKMFGNPVTNSMNWDLKKMGDLIEEPVFGLSKPLSNKTDQIPGTTPILRMANITPFGFLDVDDLRYEQVPLKSKDRYTLQKGDLLFNWRNSPKWIGKTAIFNLGKEFSYASFLFRLRVKEELAGNKFIWFYLNHLVSSGWFTQRCRQAVSQANWGRDELCDILVPSPPIELQRQFGEFYDSYTVELSARKVAKNQLENLFKITSHQAFTGDLTASWRQAYMKELLQEMELQAKALAS